MTSIKSEACFII